MLETQEILWLGVLAFFLSAFAVFNPSLTLFVLVPCISGLGGSVWLQIPLM